MWYTKTKLWALHEHLHVQHNLHAWWGVNIFSTAKLHVSGDFQKAFFWLNIKSLRLPCKFLSPLWHHQESSCPHSTLTPAGLQFLRNPVGSCCWAEQPACHLHYHGLHTPGTHRSDSCACVFSSKTLPSPLALSHWCLVLLSSYTQLSASTPGSTASVLRKFYGDRSLNLVPRMADLHWDQVRWDGQKGCHLQEFLQLPAFQCFPISKNFHCMTRVMSLTQAGSWVMAAAATRAVPCGRGPTWSGEKNFALHPQVLTPAKTRIRLTISIYLYLNLHMYICIYIYMYICICVYGSVIYQSFFEIRMLAKKLLAPFHQRRSPVEEACLPNHKSNFASRKFAALHRTLGVACRLFVQNFNHFALQLLHDLLPHLGWCLLHRSRSNDSCTVWIFKQGCQTCET